MSKTRGNSCVRTIPGAPLGHGRRPHPHRLSKRFRFWPVAVNTPLLLTFVSPRKRKRRNPCQSLASANKGSTTLAACASPFGTPPFGDRRARGLGRPHRIAAHLAAAVARRALCFHHTRVACLRLRTIANLPHRVGMMVEEEEPPLRTDVNVARWIVSLWEFACRNFGELNCTHAPVRLEPNDYVGRKECTPPRGRSAMEAPFGKMGGAGASRDVSFVQ